MRIILLAFKHFINNNIQVRVDFNTVLSIKHKHIITVVDSDEWRSIDEFLRDVRSSWHIQTLLLLATRCQTYAINLFTNNRRFFKSLLFFYFLGLFCPGPGPDVYDIIPGKIFRKKYSKKLFDVFFQICPSFLE